jgi:spermidine synthase
MKRWRSATRHFLLQCLAACCLLLVACAGTLVHEVRSDYSHIRVVDFGSQRALYFIGEADVDVVETLIDLRQPHLLQHAYSRAVMAGLLYRSEASSALLIGLGGGAIVRFLNHHFPGLRLDVVEIDPVVVRVARDYFGTSETPQTRIHVADGRDFLERSGARYDLILVDAHLHPDVQTDSTGHSLSLKSAPFYRSVRERMNPGGIVMFNMISGRDSAAYLDGIRIAFAAIDVYRPAGTGNIIVFASAHGALAGENELRARAQAFDRRGGYGFSFERLLDARERPAASSGAGPGAALRPDCSGCT